MPMVIRVAVIVGIAVGWGISRFGPQWLIDRLTIK
jgi:hypothetical protein